MCVCVTQVSVSVCDTSVCRRSCQRVEEESLIKNSSACKDYLIEAMKYHLLPADQRALMKTARTRMRTPACCPKVFKPPPPHPPSGDARPFPPPHR